jgi:hypothetical protein
MPFTRDERAVIEDLLNKIEKLDRRLVDISETLIAVSNYLDIVGAKPSILELSDEELKEILRDAVRDIVRGIPVVKHTHESDTQGGDAFAKKGATLIEDSNIENEEEVPETP